MQSSDNPTGDLVPAKVILNTGGVVHIDFVREELLTIGSEVSSVYISPQIENHYASATAYEDPINELLFKMSSDSWRDKLLKVTTKFEHLTRRETLAPIMQINDDSFFDKDCIPSHLGIPVRTILFGNMLRAGDFLSHFARDDTTDGTEAEMAELLEKLRGEAVSHSMFVDFEHDRSMLTVRFAVKYDRPKPRTNNKQPTSSQGPHMDASVYNVKMRYSSARRVVVDTLQKDSEGRFVTRMYIQLNNPVEIRRFQKRPTDKFVRQGDRYREFPERKGKWKTCAAINESPVMCLEFLPTLKENDLYDILCRLHFRMGLPLDFEMIRCSYFNVENYVASPVRMVRDTHFDKDNFDQNRTMTSFNEPEVDDDWMRELENREDFGLLYFIAALISRGSIVKDQILVTEGRRDEFMDHILRYYAENPKVTVEALERLLNMFDERRDPPELIYYFDNIRTELMADPDQSQSLCNQAGSDGYRRVRKVVITPTRMLLVVPELLMGNRVLRDNDPSGDRALRVQFRDDDGTSLRMNNLGPHIIGLTVQSALQHGLFIGSRHFLYLASSNSQMRDNGCYFFDDGDGGDVHKIRLKLGKFEKTNIPKLMARIGQCFTQAKPCPKKLSRHRYNTTLDITGGNDSAGKAYTYSDGCGRISLEFAKRIAKSLEMNKCIPSCFQIRFRGMKGVLSVDPWLNERASWAYKNRVPDNPNKRRKTNTLHILFRPSQEKFEAPESDFIEIVKYSSPTPVCLNQPFIIILDQVSTMQGYQVHKRVSERISFLLDRQLMQMAEALMSEDRCRERLFELPRRIDVDEVSLARGFALTQEPFFRSLLKASVAYTIKKQLCKSQIRIPDNLGRTMFGVVDETGILQYGQVFVQYTKGLDNKLPGPSAAKTILKGRVLMTKNPQIVAGDARVFDAVDVPELRHLNDVVVFPQYGPRPHPDEMAGSDLDGDEYCVIWDKQLYLDGNEDPYDFTKRARENDNVTDENVVSAMLKFFVDYIKQDSIGAIANAFMANADLYGITSDVCMRIALKQSQAVDFPKTGQPPDPLVRKWEDEDGVCVPPERPERRPDFMNKPYEPSYVSPRLAGRLFRRTHLVDDVLTLTKAYEEQDELKIDQSLLYQGRENFIETAKKDFSSYSADVRALLDNYGIQDEGQLFSGCISVIRNRISDRDMDDMSLYNTNHMIEKKMTDAFLRFRVNFFAEFGGYIQNTDPSNRRASHEEGSENDLRRICRNPSEDMKRKASAYYEVCYGAQSNKANSRRLLSFPWVAWDVLARVKQASAVGNISIDPLSECLTETINVFCEKNKTNMEQFIGTVTHKKSKSTAILRYHRRFKGLDKIMFVLCKWAERQQLLEGRLRVEHLCLLLIQYGVAHLSTNDSTRFTFLETTDHLIEENSPEVVDLSNRIGGVGKCFVKFMQYLSSRSFETLDMINFMHPGLGYHSIMMRGQWRDLHRAAISSFYRIVLTGRFEELSYIGDAQNDRADKLYMTEIEPFVVEIPDNLMVHDEFIRSELQRLSGAGHVHMRRMKDFKDRAMISAVGTMESLHRLRKIVAVQPPLNSSASNKKHSEMMTRLVYERLTSRAV